MSQYSIELISKDPNSIFVQEVSQALILNFVRDRSVLLNSMVSPAVVYPLGNDSDRGPVVSVLGHLHHDHGQARIEQLNQLIEMTLRVIGEEDAEWLEFISLSAQNLGFKEPPKEDESSGSLFDGNLGRLREARNSGFLSDGFLSDISAAIETERKSVRLSVHELATEVGFENIEIKTDLFGLASLLGGRLKDDTIKNGYRTPCGFEFHLQGQTGELVLVQNGQMYRPTRTVLAWSPKAKFLFRKLFHCLSKAETVSQANRVWGVFSALLTNGHLLSSDRVEVYVKDDASVYYLLFKGSDTVLIVEPIADLVYVTKPAEVTTAIHDLPAESEERLQALLKVELGELSLRIRANYNQLVHFVYVASDNPEVAGRVMEIFGNNEHLF